jgi:bacillithiol system protein YtxJ
MQPLTSVQHYDTLRELPIALVYKHSTRCPISLIAYQEVAQLQEEHPDIPVYLVDVLTSRPLSRHVAEQTGIVHHSPQLILLVRGEPAWAVSHFDVRAEELGGRLAAAVG